LNILTFVIVTENPLARADKSALQFFHFSVALE
jgi:hypothetical protein